MQSDETWERGRKGNSMSFFKGKQKKQDMLSPPESALTLLPTPGPVLLLVGSKMPGSFMICLCLAKY